MKYRQQQLLAAESITTVGTKVLDIKIPDIVSRITAKIKLTNSTWLPIGHPACAMVNMSLVDGQEVLHSMRGKYTRAVAHYGSRTNPFAYANYTDNGVGDVVFPIYFGRKLWDRELALDPKRFDNLQLKMQHNYLAGGCTPDAATLEVWADLFDENAPSPRGYLSAQSIWAKTLVINTNDYPNLPMDAPIRFVYVAAASDVEEPDINIASVLITEHAGKTIIYNTDVLTHLQNVESLWQAYEEWMEGRATINVNITFYQTAQKDVIYALSTSQDADGYQNQLWSGGGIRVVTCSATQTLMARASGRCPHGVIPFPMGDPDDIDSWWQVSREVTPEIRISTGPGSVLAQYECLVEQMRSY